MNLPAPLTGTVSSVNDKIGEDINILNDSDEMNAWILSFKDVDQKNLTNYKIRKSLEKS